MTKRCKAEWAEFTELEAKSTLNDDEKERLAILKNGFNLVLSADYQMAKLVPYWGQTAQPGSTYYLQKQSHDVFGIVDHSCGTSTVYLFDEHIEAKNTDHTVSYLGDLSRVLHGSSGSIYFLTMQQWHGLMRWYNNIYLISSIYRFLWLGTQSSPLTSCFEPSLNPTIEVMYSLPMNCIGTNPTKQV